MIEKGKLYKLKKIRNFFGKNIDDYYKILEISGELVYCKNQETGERNVINIKYFIDPEFPDDVYSDLTIQENIMNIKQLNKELTKILETVENIEGTIDYNNPNGIYRSIHYFKQTNNIEVNIWLYDQKQKYKLYLYSEKHRFLWINRFKEIFKEFNPKVFTYDEGNSRHTLKIEFKVPLKTNIKQLDKKIYKMIEKGLNCDVNEQGSKENKYANGRRIRYEDDTVIVYDPAGNVIYKGIEDYEPMKDESWRWSKYHNYYYLHDGYVKVCLDV